MKEIQDIATYRENGNSCWQCKFQKLGGTTLFGICSWFSQNGKMDKEIPSEKVEFGCKFFIPKMKTPLNFPYRK